MKPEADNNKNRPIRQPESVYRRRRLGVGVTAGALVLGGTITVASMLHGLVHDPGERQPAPTADYVARPGDSAWNIADKYADENTEIRDDVDDLASQYDGTLQIGQHLTLHNDLAVNYLREQEEQKQKNADSAKRTA